MAKEYNIDYIDNNGICLCPKAGKTTKYTHQKKRRCPKPKTK